jgi:hypothetical protein
MVRRRGVDVVKGKHVLVFKNARARHLAAKDAGKDIAVVIRLRRIDRHKGLRLTVVAASLPPTVMSDEPAESLIPYDEIVQDALRAVVGRVLSEIESSGGLPGQHHFFIKFNTRMPGVSIPKHLSERFPEEMTIVIQNRYWDLKVEGEGFSVGLSFGGVPSTLSVPFAAITEFHDPAVDFLLTFQANAADEIVDDHGVAENDAPADGPAEIADDGSNVVSVDFTRKK